MLPGLVRELTQKYLARSPTSAAVTKLIQGLAPQQPLVHDHIAFRTLGVGRYGCDSLSRVFTDNHYVQRDALAFPTKKANALWYSPPRNDPPLPRLFISELQSEALSKGAEKLLHRYVVSAGKAFKHLAVSTMTGELPWETPTLEHYEELQAESEFAAWVLVNGYSLSHATISVHRTGIKGGIEEVTRQVEAAGFELNAAGGQIKVSPDGGLLQSSTMADTHIFCFAGGEEREVPGAYIEFAERRALPEFADMPEDQLEEHHRRDGFEQAQANRIFESTSQETRASLGGTRVLFDDSEDNVTQKAFVR
jgi:hypothetical protein